MEELFRNPVGWAEERRSAFRRHRTWLGMLVAAAQLGCAFGFGAFFLGRTSGVTALAVALVAGLLGAFCVWGFRRKHPHPVPEPQLVDLDARTARRRALGLDDDTRDDEEADEGWDVSGLVLAAVLVPLAVLVLVLLASILPLLVLVGFALTVEDPSTLHFFVALGLCVLVMACVEGGLVRPLSRRWGIPLDED